MQYVWSDGEWGPVEWVQEPYLKMHVGSGEFALGRRGESTGADDWFRRQLL